MGTMQYRQMRLLAFVKSFQKFISAIYCDIIIPSIKCSLMAFLAQLACYRLTEDHRFEKPVPTENFSFIFGTSLHRRPCRVSDNHIYGGNRTSSYLHFIRFLSI